MAQLDALLGEWADVALRTLVFAERELPEFAEWNAQYELAIADPDNVRRAKLGHDNPITTLQAQVESGLTLQGATAIEDKLQDGVPEVLADLREAGIKVWMLTGDKGGTAKNIATACNILPAGVCACVWVCVLCNILLCSVPTTHPCRAHPEPANSAPACAHSAILSMCPVPQTATRWR